MTWRAFVEPGDVTVRAGFVVVVGDAAGVESCALVNVGDVAVGG